MARSWANHSGICPWSLTNISILHILRGFNPFDIISDLVNRIDQGTDVSRNVVQQVDGRHGCRDLGQKHNGDRSGQRARYWTIEVELLTQ